MVNGGPEAQSQNLSYLQIERKPQLLEHKCLQGEYEDHFWQFSAYQRGTYQIKHIIKT